MIQPVQPHVPSKKAAKVAAGTIATAAVATGAVLYMAKTGRLNAVEGGNKVLEAVKAALKKPADKILAKAEPLLAKVKPQIDKVLTPIKEKVGKAGQVVKDANIAGKAKTKFTEVTTTVRNAFDGALNKIESKFHPEKFV